MQTTGLGYPICVPGSGMAAYAHVDEIQNELPIQGYAVTMSLYVGSFTTLLLAARRAGVLPERIPAGIHVGD